MSCCLSYNVNRNAAQLQTVSIQMYVMNPAIADSIRHTHCYAHRIDQHHLRSTGVPDIILVPIVERVGGAGRAAVGTSTKADPTAANEAKTVAAT